MEGRFVEEDVLYRRMFCMGGRFVEGCYVEGRLVGRTFCSEGRFVEGCFVGVPQPVNQTTNSHLESFSHVYTCDGIIHVITGVYFSAG